jgi:hypothetical protein
VNDDLVTWLREQISDRLAMARHLIESEAASAEWHEPCSGVLVTGTPTHDDTWDGTHPLGDSRLVRFIVANDPRDTIARCEAELAILAAHDRPEHYCPLPVLPGVHGQFCSPAEGPCWTVRLLGSGYKYRTGYQEEWA